VLLRAIRHGHIKGKQTMKAIKVTIDPRTVEMQKALVKGSPEFNKALDEAKELQSRVGKSSVASSETAGKLFKSLLAIVAIGMAAGIESWMIAAQVDDRLGPTKGQSGTVKNYRSLATRIGAYWGTETLKTAAKHADVELPERLTDVSNNTASKVLGQIAKDAKNPDRVTLDALIGFHASLVRVFGEKEGHRTAMNLVADSIEDLRKVSAEVNAAYLRKFTGGETEASRNAAQEFTASTAGQFIIANRPASETENELEQALHEAGNESEAEDVPQAANGRTH